MSDRTVGIAALADATAIARQLDESVQKALDGQRERIAAAIHERAEQFLPHGAIRAVLIAVAHDIRSGEIGGGQDATREG